MSRQAIMSDKAPKAVGPYSHAIIANGFVYVAGQAGLDPATGQLAPGGIAEQTHQVLKNLQAVRSPVAGALKTLNCRPVRTQPAKVPAKARRRGV
mgnify:CR=1 FL=1